MKRIGFTLIEIVVAITVLSIASAAIFIPFLAAAKGFGGATRKLQMASLAREHAESTIRGLQNLSQYQWQSTLSAMAATPQTLPDKTLDNELYRASLTARCVAQDLSSADATCGAGYAIITITVSAPSIADNASITFVKTRVGI